MKTTTILTAALGLTMASLHAQTVPLFINYQGKVTDSTGTGLGTGTPVNRKVIFRIFDAPTAGNRLWSEQHTVTISNGEFSVLLGNGINANYAGADETPLKTTTPLDTVFTSAGILRFVEIVVDNGDNTLNGGDAPIAPRQQITSTAYCFRARSADTIAAGTDLQLNNSSDYGLGYYGSTRLFNGSAVNGPVLYGQSGGALGSVNGGTKNIALRWNELGAVGIGSTDLAGVAATTKLVVQGDDTNTYPMQLSIRGNADTNKRLLLGYNTTGNYASLQAYSAASTTTKLLLNPGGGNVGIGTTVPGQMLQIGEPNTPNSQGMMRFASRSGTGPSSRYWDIGVPEGDQDTSGKYYSFVIDDPTSGGDPEMTIRWDSGNVGIGTANPTVKLDVNGPYLRVVGAGNEQAYMGGDGAGGDIEIGSRNAAIATIGFWNSSSFQHMNVVGKVFAGTAFNTTSDRNLKENFEPVDPRGVLEKVAAMPISCWNFKGDNETPHIGPMAQDFHAAFGTGTDDKHIATVDADGVALAAIQGLNEKLHEKESEIAELRKTFQAQTSALEEKNQAMEARLAALEELLNREQTARAKSKPNPSGP